MCVHVWPISRCGARETDSMMSGLARRRDDMQQPSVSKDDASESADEKVAGTSGIICRDENFGRATSYGSRTSTRAASRTKKKSNMSQFDDESRAVALPGGRVVSGPGDTSLLASKQLPRQKSLRPPSTLLEREQATLPRFGSGRDIVGMMADVSVSCVAL
jgi:hypothetical protein